MLTEEENNCLPSPSQFCHRHVPKGGLRAPQGGPQAVTAITCEPILLARADRALGQRGPVRAGIFLQSKGRRGPGRHRTERSGAVIILTLRLVEEAGLQKEPV